MKDNGHRNSLIVIALVVVIGVIVFGMYLSPSDPFNRSKVYYEPQGNFSLQTPSSFNFQREKITEDEVMIKIVAPNDVASANPGLSNIIVYRKADGIEFKDQVAAFLSVDPAQLFAFNFTSPAYSYLSQNGQELSYYYFLENDSNIIVFKFNRTYFDKNNPLILINNSAYANTFSRILNSVKFN